MDLGITTWNVSEVVMLGVMLLVFAVIGFRRGVNRELLMIVGVVISMLMSEKVAGTLKGTINQFYKLGRMMLMGGLANPAAAWEKAQNTPPLVSTDMHLKLLGIVVFVGMVLFFYWWGQNRFPPPATWPLRALGLLAGAINGFLIVYYMFPILFPGPQTVITLPNAQVRNALVDSQSIARVVAFFVIILIAFGLHSASGASKKR